MKNKLLKLKDEIKSYVNKFDGLVKEYKDSSVAACFPNMAYMNWGIQLADDGNIDEAIEKLSTASMMVNKNPSVYINLGIALMKQKDYENAIKNFRHAVKIDKFNSKAYSMWGTALSEIGDFKGAIDVFKLAQKYSPRDADIYLNWGIVLAKANKSFEAEEKFKKSISLNPLNPITPFLWGLVLFEQKKFDEAVKKFSHCLVYTENRYDALYYMALCYLKLQDYNMALECATQAHEADELQVEPYIIMADCCMNLGQSERCLNLFAEAESKIDVKTNARFYSNWGMALQKYNQLELAREKLYNALILEPNQETILFNLGVNFLLSKEVTQAEEFFEKVLKLKPDHSQTLYNIAAISYNKQDYDRALEYYKLAFDADKKNYLIFFSIANCYHQKKDYENAHYYFKKCLEYCPDFIQAYLNYSNMLIEVGDFQDAKRKARTAFLKNKELPYSNFAYGVVLMKLGEFTEAVEKFSNAVVLDEKYDLAYLGLCESYLNLKDYNKCFDNLYKVSSDCIKTHEYDELESRLFDRIVNPEHYGEEISQTLVNTALEYCNKILELYNNDKVLVFKNILLEKYKIEADK